MTLQDSEEAQGHDVVIVVIGQTGSYAYPCGWGGMEELLW